jgi:diaminohydroxyphosphoribosylaminopyrimidine deaminase/5-amino-6-(5-phosphoribosylamino)uracil reductase
VHRWRAESDAIAVGIGTALADDPLLTARDVEPRASRQPLRVVFDAAARTPLDSALLRSLDQAPMLVIAAAGADPDRVEGLRAAGAEVALFDGDDVGRVGAALAELGRRGVTSLLLEGGATLAGAFRDAGEIDELRLFMAPIVLGGADARPLLGGRGAGAIAEAQRALAIEHERIGNDLLLRARMKEW